MDPLIFLWWVASGGVICSTVASSCSSFGVRS